MITFEDFEKLDIKTARIVDVKDHPNADRLYLLTINVGEKTKQIVAGIRTSYTIDELKDKQIVVIDNLEPVKIRGEVSEGMLLAASSENGPVIISPGKDVPAGSRVK